MSDNCRIRLIIKSKQANNFETVFSRSPSINNLKWNRTSEAEKQNFFESKKESRSNNIRVKLVSEKKRENTPKKTFRNIKIRQCIIAPYQSDQSEFQYCYIYEEIGKNNMQLQGMLCEGKKAEYKTRVSPRKEKTISRQFSQKSPNLRPSTSQYLSYKNTAFVQLNSFGRKKPWSMNPFHYQGIYMEKLKVSLDFYYKVQFANRTNVDLSLTHPHQQRYKVYVGPGNNQFMIQQILRKRFWYEVVYEPKNCHFYWTQYQLKNIHEQQSTIQINKKWQGAQDAHISSLMTQQQKQAKITLNHKVLSKYDSIHIEKLINQKGYNFVYPQLPSRVFTNHIPYSHIFSQRKIVFKNIHEYYQKYKSKDPWSIIPKTFFISNPTRAQMHFYTDTVLKNKKKLWIIKPGERQNYENTIQVLPGSKVMQRLRNLLKFGDQPWSFLLQEYVNPFLYKGRKIDLHHYVLLTSFGGIRAYWYYQGYIRTCSRYYSQSDFNPLTHLTSQTVQQKSQDYGLYEPENKLTYNDFQRYLQINYPEYPNTFQEEIIPKMKAITLQLLRASFEKLDPQRKGCNFELISLDFILDQDLQVFLVGANTNPSLRSEDPVQGKLIPSIIDQSLWLGLDPFLPPNTHYPAGQRLRLGADPLYSLKFECIFDEFQF